MNPSAQNAHSSGQLSASSSSSKNETTTTANPVHELISLGMLPEIAAELVANYGAERCLSVARYTRNHAKANPSGYAWRALTQQWVLPTAVVAAKTQQAKEDRIAAARTETEKAQWRYQLIAREREQAEAARLSRAAARKSQQRTA